MADQVRHRQVTVPAGTLSTAPLQTDISFPPAGVQRLQIFVPPGHAGLTGIALAHAHQPIIPFDAGQFIIADDEVIDWSLEDMPDSGNWQTFTYNTDVHPHTFYLRFLLIVVVRQPVIVAGPTPFVVPATTPDLGGGAVTVIPTPAEPFPTEPPPEEPLPEPEPEPEPLPEAEPEPEPPLGFEPEPEPPLELEPEPEPPLELEPESEPPLEPEPEPVAPIIEEPVAISSQPQPSGEYHQWDLFHILPDGRRISDTWVHYVSGPRQGEWNIIGSFNWGVNPAAVPPVPPWEVDTDHMVEGKSFPYLRWRYYRGSIAY